MTPTASSTTASPSAGRMPSTLRLSMLRGGIEIKQFFRERDSMVFSFAFPPAFLLLFGAIFGNDEIGGGFRYSQVLLPAMLAFGIVSTSLVTLGIWIAVDRDNGTLRRLVGTPMPRAAYFGGKVWMMLVIGFAQVAILVMVGVVVYGVHLPPTTMKWLALGWVGLLSFATLGVLGVAISSVPRSARSASAVVLMPSLALQFISGIFIPNQAIPEWLQDVAAIFPLKWIAQGFRSAFLPDRMASLEPTGTWEYGRILLVLSAWLIGGLIICLTTFRWKRRGDG